VFADKTQLGEECWQSTQKADLGMADAKEIAKVTKEERIV
jgi:hypothetical protein